MKPRVFKFIIPLALMLFGVQLRATNFIKRTDYTKNFSKEFQVSKSDLFKVQNKYGEIDIKTWDESRVKIEVTVTAKARSKEAANDMLDRIDIEFSQGNGYTSAVTEIADKNSSWSSWWSGDSNDDFKIDYTVKIPKAHSLELSNKYGHSHITDIDGSANLSAKYGDIYAQRIGKEVELYLGYGSAVFGDMKNLNGEIKYAKLKIENSGDIKIESKYSRLNLGDIGNMDIYSGYDNIDIKSAGDIDFDGKYGDLDAGKVGYMKVSSKYTSFKIESCLKGGRFSLSYGGLRIEELAPNFVSLDVDGSYSGIKVGTHASSNFTLNATSRYAGISYPNALKVTRDVSDDNNREIKGEHGSGGKQINIHSNYGSISVW